MTQPLLGRTAVVTGGNGGIGAGIAHALADSGATVVIVGRDAEKNRSAIADLEQRHDGRSHRAVELDLRRERAADDLADDVRATEGRLDILVPNAGVAAEERPEDVTDEQWDAVIDTNLGSVMRLCRATYSLLRESDQGRVITIGSMMSIFGNSDRPAYAASKGGLVQYTKSLAVAWGGDGITCNTILPGFIETPLTEYTRTEDPVFNQEIISRTPLQRWGTPAECGGLAAFLASDGARFITGAAIPVDGGYSVKS